MRIVYLPVSLPVHDRDRRLEVFASVPSRDFVGVQGQYKGSSVTGVVPMKVVELLVSDLVIVRGLGCVSQRRAFAARAVKSGDLGLRRIGYGKVA